jgi:Tol biopolymer transport system component
VKLLVQNDSCNVAATVSPDGRWIAYASIVAGRGETWIERYPELGSRQQISTGGGGFAVWSPDGRELFFNPPDAGQMYAVPVQSGTTLVAGRPQRLFEFPMVQLTGGTPYDIAPDGRFLIVRSNQAEAGAGTVPQIVFVQNWFEELKRLVPVN